MRGNSAFGRVYVAIGIDGNALAHRALIYAVLPIEWRNESCNPIFANWTDPNAVAPIRVVVRSRLGIDHVHRFALDENKRLFEFEGYV